MKPQTKHGIGNRATKEPKEVDRSDWDTEFEEQTDVEEGCLMALFIFVCICLLVGAIIWGLLRIFVR